jgi:signal transduction histidine kinase
MMRDFFRSLSIKSRIALLVVTLLVVSIWGLAADLTAVMQRDLQHLIESQTSATVDYLATDLNLRLEQRLSGLQSIAEDITPEMLAAPDKLQRFLDQHGLASSILEMDLMVAASDGAIIAAHQGDPTNGEHTLTHQQYFHAAMASDGLLIGSPVIEKDARRSYIPLTVPLRNAAGVTVATLVDRVMPGAQKLFSQLASTRIGHTGYFLLVAPKDRLIVSASDVTRIMTPLHARASPLLERRIKDGFEGTGVAVTTHGVELLTAGRKMAATGWLLVGGAPTDEMFAPIRMLQRRILLSAGAISLLIVMTLRFVLTREFARLDTMREAIRRMGNGEQPMHVIPIGRNDEIGRLKASFNHLVGERSRLDAELRAEISEHQKSEEALGKAMTRLQALSKRITTAREEERRELALELHEQSGQELAVLQIHLEILRHRCAGEDAQARIKDALMIAKLMLMRFRKIALDLHPPQLGEFGLGAALRSHCRQQAEAAGWRLHFAAAEDGDRPGRDVEYACFRAVEEALTNVSLHGNASEIWVNLRRAGDDLHLSVRDNGRGFQTDWISDHVEHERLGLLGMQERVRQVGGSLEVESKPGSGVEIRAVFANCYRSAHGNPRLRIA